MANVGNVINIDEAPRNDLPHHLGLRESLAGRECNKREEKENKLRREAPVVAAIPTIFVFSGRRDAG